MTDHRRLPNTPWTTPPRRLGIPIHPSHEVRRREMRGTLAALAIVYGALAAIVAAFVWLVP